MGVGVGNRSCRPRPPYGAASQLGAKDAKAETKILGSGGPSSATEGGQGTAAVDKTQSPKKYAQASQRKDKRQGPKFPAFPQPGTPRSGSKRTREELTPESVEKEDQLKKRSRAEPSYSGALSSEKMAIVHADYPDVEFTEEQFQLIQTIILEKIDDATHINPGFTGIRLEAGAVMLYCYDHGTANWIKGIGETLIPWDGARLKAMKATDLPRGIRAIFSVPEVLKDSDPTAIIRKVAAQNKGLDTSKWKILNSQKLEKSTKLVVRMDHDSWATIAAKDKHIFLGFTRVLVTSLEKKS
ncbi:hypothetical protein WDU94_007649 [Cyamophila willieti]